MYGKEMGCTRITAMGLVFLMLSTTIMPLFSQAPVHADYLFTESYTIEFQNPEFSTYLVNNTSYATISLADCMLTSQEGAAQLPFYSTHILIPDGCFIKTIVISEKEFKDYSFIVKQNELLFAEEETPFSNGTLNNSFQKNQSWYELNEFQPKNAYTSLGVNYMKGYPVETIHLFPMRYHPRQDKLWFHKKLTITVTFSYEESALTQSSNQFFRKHDRDREQVKDLVLNPDLIDTYPLGNTTSGSSDTLPLGDDSIGDDLLSDSYNGGICDSSEQVDYVIVTSTELAEANSQSFNWTDLLNHRQQRDGLSVAMVTMNEILSSEDYFNETAVFNDSAARLREFCKDAYLDWHTEYILLGGTWKEGDASKEIVPCRILTDLGESAGYESMPSDLYFSNLDGDWYYESDSVWGGGRGGTNDKYSELCVGRIPVWSESMVSNIVSKIIWYDNCEDQSFLRSAGFLGGDLGWTSTSKDYLEEIRVGDGSFSQYEGFEEWNTEFPDYEIDTSGKYYDEDYSSESAAINAWKTAINNNEFCLINHLDHGSATNTLSLGDGSTLSNDKFFFGTSQACLSGRYTSGDNGASSFLADSSDRGAFAMVLNTGYGYGSSTSTAGKSQLQHKMFWDYYFANQTTDFENWQLGHAMQYTKDVFSSYVDSLSSHVYAYVWYSWNLFGDPAQKIRMQANVNDAPVCSSLSPNDNAMDISVNRSEISLIISDADGDLINWSIETSADIGNNSGVNDSCGEKTVSISNLSYFTQYNWFVNVSDGSVSINNSYLFRTAIDPTDTAPDMNNPSPANNSTGIDVFTDNVSITINDSDGDNLSCAIEGDHIVDTSLTALMNSTVTVDLLDPLPYDSEIVWFVNLSDHRTYPVTHYYKFFTRDYYYPELASNFSVETINRTMMALNWTLNTSSDAAVIERNNVSAWNAGEGIEISNGSITTITDTDLLPGTSYYYQIWGYNTTDMIRSNQSTIVSNRTIGNNLVQFSNITPMNNSLDHDINLTFSVNISDSDMDLFNWSIELNETCKTNETLDVNGVKTLNLSNLSYYTSYIIWVNATDGFNTSSTWIEFRTKLPNDNIVPEISNVSFSSTDVLDDQTVYAFDQLQCKVSDNFRVANVSINITSNENMTTNITLNQDEMSSNWSVNFDSSLRNIDQMILYATDLNGNCNHTNISLPSITQILHFAENHDAIDHTDFPVDLSSIDWMIESANNISMNYTIVSTPQICSEQGLITGSETISTQVSQLCYDTSYEYQIIIEQNLSLFSLTLSFTSEEEPVDTTNIGSTPSSGEDVSIPPTPGPMEEEQNLPPEIPLPPTGPASSTVSETIRVTVSSFDENNDQIRFLIDWDDGSSDEWSEFVRSNETVTFSHTYQMIGDYEISVMTQDEQGQNSSWSQPLQITVIENKSVTPKDNGFNVSVNNFTGETQFSYQYQSVSQQASIVWDFGDGNTFEGFSPTHRYSAPGSYEVTVTITDEQGNTTMKTFIVDIPEPQEEIDTRIGSDDDNDGGSIPWIFVLIGILISCFAAIIITVKIR